MKKLPPSRLNVNITEHQQAQLAELVTIRESSMTDVVRDSVKFLLWVERQKAAGCTFCVKNPDGSLIEVVFVG